MLVKNSLMSHQGALFGVTVLYLSMVFRVVGGSILFFVCFVVVFIFFHQDQKGREMAFFWSFKGERMGMWIFT